MADSQIHLAQRENDARFQWDDRIVPNHHDCIDCHREMEQDRATRLWFIPEEIGDRKPFFREDFISVFETMDGWLCADCFYERSLEPVSDEPRPQPARLFLVKGGAA